MAEERVLLENYETSIHQLKNTVALDVAIVTGMKYTPESTFLVFI